jgi:hypothetical protein
MSPALQERLPQPPLPVLSVDDDTLEMRWARWHADAAAGDRRLQRRALFFAVVLACGFTTWLLVILHAA